MCSHTIQAPCNTSLTLTVFMDSKTLWPDPSSSHSFGGGAITMCPRYLYVWWNGSELGAWSYAWGVWTCYWSCWACDKLHRPAIHCNIIHSLAIYKLQTLQHTCPAFNSKSTFKPKLNQSFQKDFFYNHYGLVVYNHCLQ